MGSFQMKDFASVHRLFLSGAEEIAGGKFPLPPLIEAAIPGDAETATRWLRVLDAGFAPHRFRRSIERMNPAASELQALVRYFAHKKPLLAEDTERLEWLLTYIFRSPELSGGQTSSNEMRRSIEAWIEDTAAALSGTADALLSELVIVLEDLVACRSFKELTHSGLIVRGRGIKQRFKDEFSHPAVLAAVVNYNLVSGRKFRQLLSDALAGSADFPGDLDSKEYRSAAEDFRQWSAGAKPFPAPMTAPASKPPVNAPMRNGASGMNLLGIDTVAQEGRLLTLTNELVSFARNASKSVSSFPLPNSTLTLSPWEVQSLAVEYPFGERSFRAEFNRNIRRAVGLLAAIEEEMAQYDNKRHSQHLWKKHIDTLLYVLYTGGETAPLLEELALDSGRRGLQDKADQLSQTAARLRFKLTEVAELCQKWREQWVGREASYAA